MAGTSKPSTGSTYEVFLSFRGPDTRNTFTGHLYKALDDAGIYTFIDNERLHTGEQIGPELLSAIEESRISIPIFSKNYASSKWCLIELAKMVECRKIILPIFYDVDPSTVGNQTGSYAEAFREHSEKFDQTTVDRWREALREVGKLKGWDLKNVANGHQATLVRLVVEEVCSKSRKDSQIVPDNLIGIQFHVNKIVKLLNITLEDRKIVGIRGLGGIGKTTIAKVVYNTISHHFNGCSFLANIRERGVVDLQNQLVSNILKGARPNITDINEGIHVISQRLCRKKVLIVLDDADQKDQLDVLMKKRDWFGLGSRIIITTRDGHVWANQVVDEIYEPEEMDANQSLQLFSRHAFKVDQPPDEYRDLSIDIVKNIGGLPLALEVIGSSLFKTSESLWQETLEMLQDDIIDDEILKKLKISFDGLEYREKEMFLDVACFFNEMDKNIACFIWQQCNFFPERGIRILCQKSLVKIGIKNELKMHDLLRDLGKEIIRQENRKVPGGRSRLWSHKEALDVLDQHSGTNKVEGLCIDLGGNSSSRRYLMSEGFAKLTNLSCKKSESSECGKVSTFITDSELANPRLEVLILESCRSLVEMDGSISNFERLVTPNARGCNKLRELPHGMLGLTSLKNLNLHLCEGLVGLPDYMDLLGNLETLDASFCYIPKKRKREDGMVQWPLSLKTLMLGGNNFCNLQVSALSSLQTLDLRFCSGLESLQLLPSSLRYLNLLRCSSLKSLQTLSNTTRLEVLCLDDCENLVELPDLSSMRNLEKLSLDNCKRLTKIAGLDGLDSLQLRVLPSSLKYLSLLRCSSLKSVQTLSNMTKLEVLCLGDCENLVKLPDLSGMRNLEKLSLDNCKSLRKIAGLDGLDSLQLLTMKNCESLINVGKVRLPKLEELRFVGCSMLRELLIEGCETLFEIESFEGLHSLCRLEIAACTLLTQIAELSHLEELRELEILDCKSMERLPNISKLRNLKHLSTAGCVILKEIKGLDKLKSLVTVDLSRCDFTEGAKLPVGYERFFNSREQEWFTFLRRYERRLADIIARRFPISKKDELLVGIQSHVEEMLSMMDVACIDVKIVGISGRNGIGKTTIVTLVYETIAHHFGECVFLTSYFEFLELLRVRHHMPKVLVVLDDVADILQLDALKRLRKLCGLGSRIIVATRYRSMLEHHYVDVIYELDELDVDQSLRLFSWHAFGSDQPTDQYLDQSRDIIRHIGGLPFALKVIGCFLCGQRYAVWQATRKMLLYGFLLDRLQEQRNSFRSVSQLKRI